VHQEESASSAKECLPAANIRGIIQNSMAVK